MTDRGIESVTDPQRLPPWWDGALGSLDYHLSREWLGYTATSSPRFGTTLLGRDASGRSAGLCVHELDASSGPHVRIDTMLTERCGVGVGESDTGRSLGEELYPTLACGGRSIGRSRLVGDAERVGRRLLNAAAELAVDRGARSLCLLFVDDRDEALRTDLRECGYLEVAVRPVAAMPCDWGSFEEYLATLSSARRSAIRRERRRMADEGWSVERRALDAETAAVMGRLQALNERKYGNDVDEAAQRAYFVRLADGLPGRVQVLLARRADGAIAGGMTVIRWADGVFPRELGIDRSVAGSAPLYFELLFYAIVELAIATGATSVDYGLGLDDVKRSRGARIEQRHAYIKCLDPATHARVREAVLSCTPAS